MARFLLVGTRQKSGRTSYSAHRENHAQSLGPIIILPAQTADRTLPCWGPCDPVKAFYGTSEEQSGIEHLDRPKFVIVPSNEQLFLSPLTADLLPAFTLCLGMFEQ